MILSKHELLHRIQDYVIYSSEKKFILRPISQSTILEDSNDIVRLANDPGMRDRLRYFSFFAGKEDLAIEKQLFYFFRMIESKNDLILKAIDCDTLALIGTVGLHDIDWVNDNARVGIIIFNKEYIGKGYGKEIIRLLLNFVFSKMEMNKVYLAARAGNLWAVELYKKLGFKKEGMMRREYKVKEGEYIDLLRMSTLKEEWKNDSKCSY